MSFLKQIEEISKSINRSKLVRKQVTDKNGHRRTVWVRPDEIKVNKFPVKTEKTDAEIDQEYFAAVKSGDINKLREMVIERAEKMGFKNAIPEHAEGYSLRIKQPPKKTKTIYKTFYVDTNGKPSALFIGNNENIPMNVWVDAKEAFHFTDPKNGRVYVPSMGNPTNKDAGKTGDMHFFDEETKKELVKRGYITEKANSVTALAYRPGWHGGDLPFFPQGGKGGNTRLTAKGKVNKKFDPNKPETNYKNIHRWNQVVFEIEIDADNDYTETAKQSGIEKRKTDRFADDDLQYMPENGFYQFTTNPTVKKQTGGKGDWFISHSIKIKRALTEEECNKILEENGMKPQEWESMDGNGIGKMDLEKLGYKGPDFDAARKTLAPITYDDNGDIIPLSQRFNSKSDDVRKSLPENPWRKAFNLD